MKKDVYNKTQLYVDDEMNHPDYFAHWLRWQHVLRHVWASVPHETPLPEDKKLSVLDVGCGDFALGRVLYRNKFRFAIGRYLGVDVKDLGTVASVLGEFMGLEYEMRDASESLPYGDAWDVVACFEVLEHMPRERGLRLLDNLAGCVGPRTKLFLSTPVAKENVLPANHVYEWGFDELMAELRNRFEIEDCFGTFAEARKITADMDAAERDVYRRLHRYYHYTLMAVVFAPLHPSASRDCLWRLSRAR